MSKHFNLYSLKLQFIVRQCSLFADDRETSVQYPCRDIISDDGSLACVFHRLREMVLGSTSSATLAQHFDWNVLKLLQDIFFSRPLSLY